MKSFRLNLVVFVTILLSHKAFGRSVEEEVQGSRVVSQRELTPEEETLANEARAEIAKAIQTNLIRIFAIATARQEHPYVRQEEEDELPITPNPNVLPQVAQILGAIFSGSLNITRIVDSTVGLVPNLVRGQLQGLVKLLTGENVNLSGASSTASPPKEAAEATTTEDLIFEDEPTTTPTAKASPTADIVPTEAEATTVAVSVAPVVETEATTEATTELPTTTGKTKYRVMRNKTRKTTTTAPITTSLVDDEVEKIERDIIAAGRILEPYEQNKEPRFYAGMFNTVLQNMNMTEIAQAVPTIFKGATQAFVMLENLGVLDTLPGAEVLEELNIIDTDDNDEE